ncbi:hypothetical protein TNCT_584241 [Trichonephila clavata]|uniref:Uncharacterized protein n=1 Tax=Trichonephila clavata TaxID=2740835 RepID=A0A8X6M1L1_TRICU|nr:hypothetical protein TNCT_584241 [Trichonephila clavata]
MFIKSILKFHPEDIYNHKGVYAEHQINSGYRSEHDLQPLQARLRDYKTVLTAAFRRHLAKGGPPTLPYQSSRLFPNLRLRLAVRAQTTRSGKDYD